MRREARISYPFGPATQLPRRDGTRERRNGLRADARACEGAARGVGVPASDRAGVWGGAPRRSVDDHGAETHLAFGHTLVRARDVVELVGFLDDSYLAL